MPFPSSETISCPSASCMPRFLHVILMRVHLLHVRLYMSISCAFVSCMPITRALFPAPFPSGFRYNHNQPADGRPRFSSFFPLLFFPFFSFLLNFFHFFSIVHFSHTSNFSESINSPDCANALSGNNRSFFLMVQVFSRIYFFADMPL